MQDKAVSRPDLLVDGRDCKFVYRKVRYALYVEKIIEILSKIYLQLTKHFLNAAQIVITTLKL